MAVSADRWGKWRLDHDPRVLSEFRARKSDVIISTARKSGTTWMQNLLHQLRTGGDDQFACLNDVVPWLELWRPRQNINAMFEAMPGPRVFKSHCVHPFTPGVDTARFIVVSRDPRECCVSGFHHVRNFTDELCLLNGVKRPETFEAFFDQWIRRHEWYDHVASWWPHHRDPNVLWIRYADMKRDLVPTTNRILEFVGWAVAPEAFERALELSSFAWMRANEHRFTKFSSDGIVCFKPGGFIRKGAVAGYSELMSDEQSRAVLDEARRVLPPDCFDYLGIGQ